MTKRQAALIEYLRTITPHIKHARTRDEQFVAAVKCMAEDIGSVGETMLMAFAASGTKVITDQIDRLSEQFAQKAGSAIANLFSSGRGPKRRP